MMPEMGHRVTDAFMPPAIIGLCFPTVFAPNTLLYIYISNIVC